MTSDLDKKIRTVLENAGVTYRKDMIAKDAAVDQIKQAFKDAGYLTPQERATWHDEHFKQGHVTAQEWYDRFEKELEEWFQEEYNYGHLKENILDVAKKAAGTE